MDCVGHSEHLGKPSSSPEMAGAYAYHCINTQLGALASLIAQLVSPHISCCLLTNRTTTELVWTLYHLLRQDASAISNIKPIQRRTYLATFGLLMKGLDERPFLLPLPLSFTGVELSRVFLGFSGTLL